MAALIRMGSEQRTDQDRQRAALVHVGSGRTRIASIDVVRGLVMVLMVLDHSRDLVNSDALRFDPLDPSQSYPLLFATRWITHVVAPTFVLLAGISVALQLQRGSRRSNVARFLLIRGFLLIILELTVVRAGIWFNLDIGFLGMLQVIWVLGVSMIVLAGLIFLPPPVVLAIGIVLVAGHNLLDAAQPWPGQDPLWTVLHTGGFLSVISGAQPDLIVLYPLIPWPGVMALGFCLGSMYEWDAGRRRRALIIIGSLLLVAFVTLRLSNVYGDTRPWVPDGDPVLSVMSFLNVQKYPPSLDFLLVTLGLALFALAWFERTPGRLGRALGVLGSVPLFFYVLQWFAVHGLAVALEAGIGQDVSWQFMAPPAKYAAIPPDAGLPLWAAYGVWIVAVAILYPACKWYARVRHERGGWLRYV